MIITTNKNKPKQLQPQHKLESTHQQTGQQQQETQIKQTKTKKKRKKKQTIIIITSIIIKKKIKKIIQILTVAPELVTHQPKHNFQTMLRSKIFHNYSKAYLDFYKNYLNILMEQQFQDFFSLFISLLSVIICI